jgi:hypothetical protein
MSRRRKRDAFDHHRTQLQVPQWPFHQFPQLLPAGLDEMLTTGFSIP